MEILNTLREGLVEYSYPLPTASFARLKDFKYIHILRQEKQNPPPCHILCQNVELYSQKIE